MKKFKQVLLTSCVMAVAASASFAACPLTQTNDENIQSYAHPTQFTDSAIYSSNNGTYAIGGKIQKKESTLSFAQKDRVYIEGWAKDILKLIGEGYAKATGQIFDTKLPVLRSELAIMLAEGFMLAPAEDGLKSYDDITADYWASGWIYRALNAGIMIGYPSNRFLPDRPVTKAEVFATIAQIIDTPYDAGKTAPKYKGDNIIVPTWAYNCTKEVVASGLLAEIPDQDKIAKEEYLTKEQVAYLLAAVVNAIYEKNIAVDQNAPDCVKNYRRFILSMKMKDRVDARHSTAGDTFTARTTKEVNVKGKTFPADSVVRGEVVEVQRPGLNEKGSIKVKFNEIKNGEQTETFPNFAVLATANVDTFSSPNILARVAGAPLSASGRVAGVAGRSVGAIVNTTSNRAEELGDNLSNVFVETFTLHPGSGLKSLGGSVATVGKGIYDYSKIITSGVFGVLYELGDEVVYMVAPSYSKTSALNPDDEITVEY